MTGGPVRLPTGGEWVECPYLHVNYLRISSVLRISLAASDKVEPSDKEPNNVVVKGELHIETPIE